MNRQEYNACISQGLKGKKLGKEERQLEFCILAKTCSGKAGNREEAKLICSQTKEPKPLKVSRREGGAKSCEKEVMELAHCVVGRIDINQVNDVSSLEAALANAMKECRCQRGGLNAVSKAS